MPSKGSAVTWALIFAVACFAAAYSGFWFFNYKPVPIVIEKPVTVGKAVPCSPAQTGAATSKGTKSPAMSGSGNSVNYGTPPAPKKP